MVCYYALGDADRMKKGFAKLLSIPPPVGEEDDVRVPAGPPALHRVPTPVLPPCVCVRVCACLCANLARDRRRRRARRGVGRTV